MLNVSDLTLMRSEKNLLDKVSLSIKPGQLTIILGPNGAGKSTLLKCCSGALQADAGHITLDDTPLENWSLAELAKKRAVLTQQIHLPFALTVKEVVFLGLAPWSLSDFQASELIHNTLIEVGMPDTETRQYASLSGGEQQRIQLARVLVQLFADQQCEAKTQGYKGKYLLLDEPISALDLHQQQRILRLLKNLAQKGLGIFCILHDINLATLYGDKLVLLEKGKVTFNSKPQQLAQGHIIETAYQADLIRLAHPDNQLPQWQFRQ
ncbi:heme ABC transporter ATP-binding protein [Marinomonas rhizomae]|uniref:Iron complex transport system ATP-binding protein n=2 Tax=Marinomonas rhizomae TaxID=491948 RepID=A0A366JAC0_9GAMM|nr:heme ABC transporter ATP-binding protein [Marinomonas rhizomae]RBP83234.1 iron complex transport system ATP-binding protein [Marinomonas rhizomae]